MLFGGLRRTATPRRACSALWMPLAGLGASRRRVSRLVAKGGQVMRTCLMTDAGRSCCPLHPTSTLQTLREDLGVPVMTFMVHGEESAEANPSSTLNRALAIAELGAVSDVYCPISVPRAGGSAAVASSLFSATLPFVLGGLAASQRPLGGETLLGRWFWGVELVFMSCVAADH